MDWPGTPVKQEWPGKPVEAAGEQPAAPAQPTGDMSWGDVGKSAVMNAPSSAVEFGKAVAHPFMHPIETANTLFRDIPMGLAETAGMIDRGGEARAKTDAIGGFFKDRYGGVENVKRTLATDPVGAAADASMLLTGGGAAAARLPGVAGKVGEAVRTAGRVADPLSIPIEGAKLAGKGAAELIGGLGTHTGAESLKTAARAGAEGGEAARVFQENLRGTAPMAETVDAAREAVKNIRQERGDVYRSGMGGVAADKTVLDFDQIDKALADVSAIKTYKGQNLSPKTQDIRLEIGEAIREWKYLDPVEFHTVEGLDALKQKIGNIRDATERGSPARVVADQSYQAVRKTIVDQAPEYAKVMKGYEEASIHLKELEKALSLDPNASIDSALRKLQTALRDNVSTAFGRRRELAQYLVDAGAPQLMERLAGQALKPWTPRGLAKLVGTELLAGGFKSALGVALGGVAGAAASSGALLSTAGGAVATLPFMSPRIMGEGAYYAGKASNIPARDIARTSFQAGRIADRLDPREMVKNDAAEALRNKQGYTKSQLEAIRTVAGGAAPIDTVMAVKRLLESRSYEGVQ